MNQQNKKDEKLIKDISNNAKTADHNKKIKL